MGDYDLDGFQLNDKQKADCHNTFNLFDKKGDGKASTKDLGTMFKGLGIQLKGEALEECADDVDEDGSGYFTFEQFLPVFTREKKRAEDEKELREAFRVLDKNNRGCIDVADLRWILKSLGDELTEEEIDDMIAETDTDGSGTVDYEEFYALMMG